MHEANEDKSKAIARISDAIPFRLARINVLLNAQAVSALRSVSDLSLNEWRVFYLVNALQPITSKGLSQPSAMDPALISRGVNALIGKGLLNVARTEKDQRKRMLSLSEQGIALMDKLGPIMTQRRAELDRALTGEERDMLDIILKKLEQQATNKEE